MADEDVHVEDHRAFRTYAAVTLIIGVAILNHFNWISNELTTQLIGILLALALAAMRYGQQQEAATVKTALKKQEVVVKAAIVQAEGKKDEAIAEVAKSVDKLVEIEGAEAEHKELRGK